MLSFRICPVCESYAAGKPVFASKILIIGNFILIIPKLLIYSIFEEEKFINGRFALHNSEKLCTFAKNFGKEEDEK